MRISTLLLALTFPTALLLTSAMPQKRVEKEQKELGFSDHVAAAQASYAAEHWGKSASSLQAALSHVLNKRRAAVIAALPNPGEGWTLEESKEDSEAQMFAMALTGFTVEANFKGPENARITSNLMLGSPMAQMMAMQFSNPAFRDENVELVEYEKHKALLTKQSNERYQLQILMGSDVIQVESRGISDDRLLEIYSEAALGTLEAATKN